MTNPMNPNSRTIAEGDPTKIRAVVDYADRYSSAWMTGEHHGGVGMEIPHSSEMLSPDYMAGYFAGCDRRRGIVR